MAKELILLAKEKYEKLVEDVDKRKEEKEQSDIGKKVSEQREGNIEINSPLIEREKPHKTHIADDVKPEKEEVELHPETANETLTGDIAEPDKEMTLSFVTRPPIAFLHKRKSVKRLEKKTSKEKHTLRWKTFNV